MVKSYTKITLVSLSHGSQAHTRYTFHLFREYLSERAKRKGPDPFRANLSLYTFMQSILVLLSFQSPLLDWTPGLMHSGLYFYPIISAQNFVCSYLSLIFCYKIKLIRTLVWSRPSACRWQSWSLCRALAVGSGPVSGDELTFGTYSSCWDALQPWCRGSILVLPQFDEPCFTDFNGRSVFLGISK